MTSLPYTPPTAQPSNSSAPPTNGGESANYAPSVPISLYRELAGEVKEKQVMLESLQQQNRQLLQQNQQLRGEIEQLARSVVRLQQIVNIPQPSVQHVAMAAIEPPIHQNYEPTPRVAPPQIATPPRPVDISSESGPPLTKPEPERPQSPPDLPVEPENLPLVTEQEERPYARPSAPERASEMNGIGLAIAIFLIAALAGTASFLIVRPLIQQGNPK
ncbi:hypothetical protein [Roseofilum casamattae]|uniref:Uncharacterized protein n=1 Tax=Roseofilum casamattae BLCC-M143 TaxID=3022442 RepID=A0ABT7BWE2_9CYAN|nr:hypothetical protein [Roseofilum casamattae]MDJ1183522.1 hypothetical protein [Roseofilum casamattae BLCC-M143]